MKKVLFLAIAFLAFANLLNAQSLGNYSNTTVNEGSSINITPSAAPSGITRLSAYSNNGSFTGSLTVSPTTGVITVVNPTGVGTYPIVVKSSNGVTKTFNLTVAPPFCAKKAYQTPVSINSVATGSALYTYGSAYPTSTAVGDFNKDGKKDIVISNKGSVPTHGNPNFKSYASINVKMGDGLGGFGADNIIGVGTNANNMVYGEVEVGDVNADGNDDIVVLGDGSFPNYTAVYLGNGVGGFATPIYYGLSTSTSCLSIKDINKDGLNDLVYKANVAGVCLVVVLNSGNATNPFNTWNYYTTSIGQYGTNFVFDDFNRDGNIDFAHMAETVIDGYYGVNTHTLKVYHGNGAGSFSWAHNISSQLSTTKSTSNDNYQLALTDVNNDGRNDVVAVGERDVNTGTNILYFYLPSTTSTSLYLGNYSNIPTIYAEIHPLSSGVKIATGDFNGDGNNDISIAYYTSPSTESKYIVLYGNGSFTPSFPGSTPIQNTGGRGMGGWHSKLISGDFDSDGRLDLLTVNSFSDNITLIKPSGGLTNADISPISLSTPTTYTANGVAISASNICLSGGAAAMSSFVTGGYNPKFTWYKNGTPISRFDSAYQYGAIWVGSTSLYYMYEANSSGNYSVSAKNDNKTCPSLDTTNIVFSTSTAVSFTPTLTPTVTITSTTPGIDTAYCAGQFYTFNANITNAGTNPTVTWYYYGNTLLTNTANTQISNNGRTISINSAIITSLGVNINVYCKVTPQSGGCYFTSEGGSTGVKTSNYLYFGRPKGLGNAAISLTADGNASQVCSPTYMVFSANATGMDVANSLFDWKQYSYNNSTYTLIYNSGPGNATGLATNVDGLSIVALEVTPSIDGCLLTNNKLTEVITMGPNSAAASNSFRIISTIIPNANIGNSSSFTANLFGFSFVIGNRAYIGGGNGSTSFWSYEAGSRSGLRRETDMPFTSYEGSAFTSNGKGYVLVGRTGSNINTYAGLFMEYDPVTKAWTNKSSALNNTDLFYSCTNATFTINDFGYIGGGRVNSSGNNVYTAATAIGTAKWYKYDPIQNQFYSIADYPNNATSAIFNGTAFSVAGKGFFLKQDQLYKYDPDANSWSNTNRGYPIAGYYTQSAFTIGNYAYVGLGVLSNGTSDTKFFFEFNGLTEQWTGGGITSFGVGGGTAWTGMHAATGFSIGNKGYIVGGQSRNQGNAANPWLYEFTPQYSNRSIATYGLQSLNLCKGSTLTLKYNAGEIACGSLNFPSDNIFTAQLSDENGSFHNPTTIGSLTSTAQKGSITFTIPTSVTAGTRYRIRVNASSPRTIGFDNGINITIGDPASPGSISHDYSIPYPTELTLDSVKNTASVLGAINGYFWQKSNDTSNASGWGVITDTSINRTNYILPTNYTNDVYIRRAAVLGCLTTVYTNPVKIRVYSAANSRLNGSISGSVKSTNGVGVYGVPVYAQKRSALLGSPQSKIYQTTTDISGAYIIRNVFYGDLNNGDSTSAVFNVWPALANHGFTPASQLAELSNVNYTEIDKNFIDTSTYSVRGKVMQYCNDCEPGFQSDSLNGVVVNITKGTLTYPSGTTGSDGYGRYGVTFTDPGSYKFVPNKTGNTFTPVERTVNIVNSDLTGMDFTNTTRYNISGLFRAGANEVIGTATLEFADTMVPARFKKIITTNADGTYSVSLPARTYKITVIGFTPNAAGNDISTNDLLTWFNVTIKDSLQKISIDGSSKTVNLIYHRAPVLYIENLPDTSCGNYAVFKQDVPRSFKIKVYEGDASHNCLLSYDTVSSIKLNTSVPADNTIPRELLSKPVNGVSNITLIGGAPNIAGDHFKQFEVDFTDRYSRMATRLQRNAVVLGLKANPSTFTTVSPSVPILILHAPPGDQSTSFWEQNTTTESAMSFSSLSDKSTNKWVDVQVGTAFTAGIGFTVETSIWANYNTSITNSQRVSNAREAIISSSTSVSYATEPNGGDVYVGGAINMAYAISNELLFRSDTTDGCLLGLKSSLAIAPKGFATTYTYSESFITDNLIPRLQLQAVLNTDSTKELLNQVSIWQQVIANNNANKERAGFVRNRSFDGNAGPITESTTSSATNTNTIAFEMEIDQNVAFQAGVEIGGIGVSGGATVDMRMTTGNSTTNTTTTSTTMGYTLDDDDAGDFFSVDIKKDPVYNTPVFVLVAGTASCPAEPIAQSRDQVQLNVPTNEIRNIPANGEALFQLQLQNVSESREARTCYLTFNQSSNPNGALVTIGGSPVTSNISYTIPYLGSQIVTVSVKKSGASPVFSYEGLQFTLSDACDGGVSDTRTISAYFISPCSDLIMNAPVNNWVVKSSDNNILPVEFTGYNLSNLQSVALEYAHAGRGDWRMDTTVYQNFITNPTTSVLNWNTRRLADGEYDIRMKLNCSFGSGYTQRLTGTIDRIAPILFGVPNPTDGTYANGDEISMSYKENIGTTNLNIDKVRMTRMSNGADIPVQVSGYQNKLMIMPLVNINTFTSGEAIRVITKNIADVYGNTSTVFDTLVFTIGTSVATPTTRQVKVSNLITSKRSVYENSGDSLQVRFSVPTASTYNTVVHYIVSGNAEFNNDYATTFSSGQNLTTSFNGVEGTINIPANATWAVLNIKPIADDDIESNETVTIRLLSGGDYTLGADSTSVLTDSIKNDDITKPEVTLGELSTTSPTGYCLTVTDNSLAKTYVWNVPETLPTGYCETATNNSLIRPYVWNVPETLPAGYCNIQMDYSLLKPVAETPIEVISSTLPTGYCNATSGTSSESGAIQTLYSQDFNAMGTSANASLPTGFAFGTDWTTGTTATTASSFSSVTTAPTMGGLYNYGDGISTSTDRALVILNSGSFVSPRSIILKINNNTNAPISSLNVAFDYEKYRTGSRQFNWNFYHGSTSTPSISDASGDQSYAADAISGQTVNPPTSISKSFTISGLKILVGSDYYLSWTFTGLIGSTNAQAIGIDNISVSGNAEVSYMQDEQINAVSFGSMNNVETEDCTTGYTDYSATVTAPTVYFGESIPFSVTTDECDAAPYYSSGLSIYLDYNRDGDFDDAGEQAYTSNSTTISPNTRTGNIQIPANATQGITKMRVVVAEGNSSPSNCGTIGYGEVEDYAVMILKPVPTLPTGYCYAEAPNTGDEQIFSVSFGSMNNVQSENCATGYTDYSASIAPPTVHLNEVIPFSVFTDECDGYFYYPSGLSIFIDYNRDGNFDEITEMAYTSNGTTVSPNTRSGNVVIPTSATPGLTKMRVVVSEGRPTPGACGNMGYGEVEDYAIMIDSTPAPSILADEQIFSVSFGTMNNTQTENCSSNYTDYSASILAPVVTVGETVPFSVLTDECDVAPYFASGMSVYIDYNRDGDFDDVNEQAYTTSATTMSPNTRSGNIVIPVDAAEGLTKMRIVVAENVASPSSCLNLGYGEVEDYSIMIHGIPTPQSINDDQQIFAVNFGSMNNVQSENCSTNYTDYTTSITPPVVTTGTYVPFSVLTDECDAAPYYSSGMSIFIDYNRDGDFDDAGENAYATYGTAISPNTRTGNIYIPTDATLGLTKMRVVVQEGDIAPASCISLGYGEVEDYAIMIHNVPPVQTVLDDEQIKAVSFGSMNNVQSDNCNTNYTDYSSSVTVPTVLFGESVPFSIVTDECDNAPYYASGMSIFIDYNRDGDFDDLGEKAYTTNETTISPNTRSGEIVIPENATRGLTKMRVVVAEGISSPDACIPMGYGEVEDYGLMIMDGEAAKICQGGTAVLSANDQIDGQSVYSYVWKLGNNIIGTSRNITINAAGIYTLKVYTANGFSGASIPYVVTATAPPSSDFFVAVCPSQLPYSWNGINYNTTGNYNRTISNANGCDSIVNLHFTVKPNSYTVETISAIDTYEWHGTVYDASTNTATWTGVNAAGCDSIVTLNLTIIPICVPVERIYDIIACNSYTWHGIRFTNSVNGIEWTTLNYRGCDSTEILNLTIKRSSTSTTNVTVCASQMPYLWNNTIYSTAGTFTKRFNNAAGCDSTARLLLTVNAVSSSTTNVSVCANDMPYTWNDIVYNTGGSFTQTFTNAKGCDSTSTLVLTIKPVSNSNNSLSICSSQLPLNWNGLTLTATGTYSASFNNINGCDSIALLNLTVKEVSNVVETVNVSGSSYSWHGTTYTTSNYSATWVGRNAAGCDSIVTLNLTLTNDCVPTQSISNVTACNVYFWRGIRLTTSTTLEWVGVNAGGCDSVEILNLTITNVSPSASPATITQTLISNVCGARVYRYTAAAVTNAVGYNWTLPISVGGISGVFVDSGDATNSRVILVRYTSTLAAFTTDSIKVRAYSACGTTGNRSAKLLNTLFTVPTAPATITITPIVTNICGAKRYRYTAPTLPVATTTAVGATGYIWAFRGVLGATIDSGTVNSRIIAVTFSSNAAAATGDSVKLCYTSSCGNSLFKASKLTNTLLAAPLSPTVTVTPVQTNICGVRKYRYTASALVAATTTSGAATGWLWSLPAEGTVGSTGVLDSGSIGSQTIVVVYTSNAAAAAGDTIRVAYTSACGLSVAKATKLTNTALNAPLAPATVTITPLVTNICGARKYRYTAAGLVASTTTASAATGWFWSLPAEGTVGSTGTLDSGTINSQTIVVVFSSNAAAIAGDSIRVRYTSGCGLGATKATKLTNTLLGAPLAPATIAIAIASDICGARVYRYTAPALYIATTTAGAANGYLWHMPKGTLGLTGVLDSGSLTSKVIKIRYSSNAAALTGDSIKVAYTSACGNSLPKAQKLSNLAPTLLAAPATLTGTTSICSAVGTSTSNRYIASAVTGALSYVWTLPAGAVLDSGSNGLKIKVRFLTAGANDSIFVQAVGTNGCAGAKKVLKLVTTGCVTPAYSRSTVPSATKAIVEPMSVNVYPNPTTNAFQMFVKTPTASKITMRVLDVQGRLIKTISFNSDETIAFGNDLKSGVYMVELREGNVIKTVRVVKY